MQLKFSMLQLIGIVTFAAFACAMFSAASGLVNFTGRAFIVFSVFLFVVRFLFAERPLREHVPHDASLRFWSDLIGFGVPATMGVWLGIGLTTGLPGLGLVVALAMLGTHIGICVSQR